MSKSVEKMLTIDTEGICPCVTQLSKSYLALASNDIIEIWNLRTEKLASTLTGHTDIIFTLKLLRASASIFASSSNDKTIRIWKANTKMCLKVLQQMDLFSFMFLLISRLFYVKLSILCNQVEYFQQQRLMENQQQLVMTILQNNIKSITQRGFRLKSLMTISRQSSGAQKTNIMFDRMLQNQYYILKSKFYFYIFPNTLDITHLFL